MKERDIQQEQVNQNFEAIQKLMAERPNIYRKGDRLLMHDGEVMGVFETSKDALTAGRLLYGRDGYYSTQEWMADPICIPTFQVL